MQQSIVFGDRLRNIRAQSTAICLCLASMAQSTLLPSLDADARGPGIVGSLVISGKARRLAVMELEVRLQASFVNPFDRRQVSLDALITAPSGRKARVPGFFFRPFRREIRPAELPIAYASDAALAGGARDRADYDQAEVMIEDGPASWRVRFTPVEEGVYSTVLTLRDRDGVTTVGGPRFRVGPAARGARGFARIDPSNRRMFGLSTGESFFPLGSNLCWSQQMGTYDFDRRMPRYAEAGCNWIRVWLSPMWTTFGIDRPGVSAAGLPQIDLGNAWRLDYVLEKASKLGLWVDLAMDSYNVLRAGEAWPEWRRSPFNVANGGPLRSPAEFWTDPVAARQYENKLAYIVARWGAYSNVFAFEFWNEVDGVSSYDAAPVRAWHDRMARFLHALDPFDHLVTTSFGGGGPNAQDAALFALPGIDFAVSHIYGAPDVARSVLAEENRLEQIGKPWFLAETGADSSGPREKDDPKGVQLHDPLWASIASGASGGAMPWWWDSLIEPLDLYKLYRPARRFVSGIDLGKEHLHRADASVAPRGGGSVRCLVVASAGSNVAFVWVRADEAGWEGSQILKSPSNPVPPSTLTVNGLPGRRYRAELWDTWTGKVLRRTTVKVGADGSAKVELPAFDRDLAIRLIR